MILKKEIVKASTFDLAKTVESGQMFHFTRISSGDYFVAQRESVCRLFQVSPGADLEIESEDPDFWSRLLKVSEDLKEFEDQLSHWAGRADIVTAGHGLRLIVQDPWEAAMQFIGSAQRTTAMIRDSYQYITQMNGYNYCDKIWTLSDPIEFKGMSFNSVNLGFRAPFAESLVRVVNSNGGDEWFRYLKSLSLKGAISELEAVRGIGPKIANCIALYGLGFGESVPVDVQIDRALTVLGKSAADVMFNFGKKAGLAQLYLYQWIRKGEVRL